MADTNTTPSKREARIQRFFLNEGSDEPTGRAQENTHTIGFKFVKNDEEIRFELAKVFGGSLPPPSVGRAAAAFGVSTSAGNAGNTAASTAGSDDPEVAMEAVNKRLEQLESGEWSAERDDGTPRTSLLMEAFIAWRIDNKAPVDEAAMAPHREKFKDKEHVSKIMAHPQIRAKLEAMKAERAVKRAQEKAAKAAESAREPVDNAGLLN